MQPHFKLTGNVRGKTICHRPLHGQMFKRDCFVATLVDGVVLGWQRIELIVAVNAKTTDHHGCVFVLANKTQWYVNIDVVAQRGLLPNVRHHGHYIHPIFVSNRLRL